MSEYPIQQSGVDGTGLTDAICPVHKGKPRTVSADALRVAGASEVTALRCYEELSDAERKKAGAPTPGATSLPSREFSPGASDALRASRDHCQEMLVPLESRDAQGRTVRKGGKLLDKPIEPKAATKRGEDQGPKAFEAEGAQTGGEKVARAAGTPLGAKKATKKSASKSRSKKAA